MKAFRKETLFKIVSLFFSLAVSMVLCEVVLRFWLGSVQSAGYYFWPPRMNAVFKPSPDIMPGISGETRFRTNALGIRGEELASDQTDRILALGASTTQCGYLDQTETWTHLLQETLNRNAGDRKVWVGNGGVNGLTSRHHLVALQTLPLRDWKINDVIVFCGVNDFMKRLARDNDYDPRYLEKPGANRELLAQTFMGTFQFYPEDPFLKRTAIWQMLRKSKRLFSTDHLEDQSGTIYTVWREHRRKASELREAMPDLTSGLAEYAGNLNQMMDIARDRSVRLHFMTQPSIWKPALPPNLDALLWLGGVGDYQKEVGKPYYSAAALARGMQAYNDTLLRVCRERNIECLDLASVLEKDTSVFYDDVHFNESGARRVAEALSRFLLEQAPFRRPPAAR